MLAKLRGKSKNRESIGGDGESNTVASSSAAPSEESDVSSEASSDDTDLGPWANEPTTWVDPVDSDDEEKNHEALQPGLTGLDDALLGKLDDSSVETRRLRAALTKVRGDGDARTAKEVNVVDESFDPRTYLSIIHKATPLVRLLEGSRRIKTEMEEGKTTRQAKQLVRFNLARYVSTQDRMLDLHQKLSDSGAMAGHSAEGSIAQLRRTLDAVSHLCDRIYLPMIERHDKSSQIHSALALLNRHHEALSLPSQIKAGAAVGAYDRVVLAYSKAVATLRNSPQEILKELMRQVEFQVGSAKEQLRGRLRDHDAPVIELSKCIQYLTKLELLQLHSNVNMPQTKRGKLRFGGATEGEDAAGAYCMKCQKDAVLVLMRRCHSSFVDQVADMGRSSDGGQGENGWTETISGNLTERDTEKQDSLHKRLRLTYESLALTLCSSLTSILLWHTQRLMSLDEAMRAQSLRDKDSVNSVGAALRECIETYGLLLRPVFVQERDIGGTMLRPSLEFQLRALELVHEGRVELRGSSCPEELLINLGDVISSLCRDALHDVFRQVRDRMSELTHTHAQTPSYGLKRDIETGTSELPMHFRAAVSQAVQKVKGLVTLCDDVTSDVMTSCFAAVQHFLDCLHALSLGESGDKENDFLFFWEARSTAGPSQQSSVVESVRRGGGGYGAGAAGARGGGGQSWRAEAGGLVERTGMADGDGGSGLLLMALSDCVWVRKNCQALLQECASCLTRDKTTVTQLVPPADVQDLARLCNFLEDMIAEKYVRGSTLALTRIFRVGLVQREGPLSRNESEEGYTPDGVREYVTRALMLLVTVHESLRCIGEDVRDAILAKVVAKLWWTCSDFVGTVASGVQARGARSKKTIQAQSLSLQIDAEIDFLKTALKRFENETILELLRDLDKDLEILLFGCGVDMEAAETARRIVSRDALFRSRILAECLE